MDILTDIEKYKNYKGDFDKNLENEDLDPLRIPLIY